MYAGYVALLDVLGFSNLIAGENADRRVHAYLECLNAATEGTEVEFVVFSDSIVLTARDEAEALFKIASTCSRLMHDLVLQDIPVRGAIAKGQILRETVGHNVFVAGRAVVEAYHFEQQQDWVGIMLAPSAVQSTPGLTSPWFHLNAGHSNLVQFEPHLLRLAAIQSNPSIPFHSDSPFDEHRFAGYVIIPNSGVPELGALRDSLQAVINKLNWLRMVAPTPAAQQKYSKSVQYLQGIQNRWAQWAQEQEVQNPSQSQPS